MSVNGISSMPQAYDAKNSSREKVNRSEAQDRKQNDQNDTAVVYDKSNEPKEKVYKRDSATIDRLLAESEKRSQSLRDLVRKMLLKQGETYSEATDIYALLREGKLKVDPETSAQAQKDVAEDGYFGVKQTSERLLSFAVALTGGDPSKADEMIDAVKKGFEQATKAWGGDLPDISRRTYDETIKKLETWRDSAAKETDKSSTEK